MSAQNKLGLYEFESERTDCNSLSPSANERAAFQRFDILYDSEHTCSKQTLKQFSPLCLVRCCGFVGSLLGVRHGAARMWLDSV